MGNDPFVDFPAGFGDTRYPSNASLPHLVTCDQYLLFVFVYSARTQDGPQEMERI